MSAQAPALGDRVRVRGTERRGEIVATLETRGEEDVRALVLSAKGTSLYETESHWFPLSQLEKL